MEKEHCYVAIDLKSFYASVECRERGLDPLTTNLVVADPERTEKTICLAVTPALKAYGISGRARLFEVVERVRAVNAERLRRAREGSLRELRRTRRSWRPSGICPGLHHSDTPYGPLSGIQLTDIRDLSELYCTGGYACLFHRRGIHGCKHLSEYLSEDAPGAGGRNDPGSLPGDRHHSCSRDRY